MKARKATPKAPKAPKRKPAKRPRPTASTDVLVARALEALAAVDRRDPVATAHVLAHVFETIAARLDSTELDASRRRTLARRIRAARRKMLGRRRKREAPRPPPAPARVQTLILPALQMPNPEATRVVVIGEASEPPPTAKAPSTVPPPPPEASWLPKTLHAAGVVEGHEPTAVVLGLLREALTSATTKRDTSDDAALAVRPLPVVLADLFGAFGLSRSAPPRDSKDT